VTDFNGDQRGNKISFTWQHHLRIMNVFD